MAGGSAGGERGTLMAESDGEIVGIIMVWLRNGEG